MSAMKIMIQGTMSDAGKSAVCAALCRIFRQDGYSVAPFKGQNMALNSYITTDGLEMGRAQVMQAEAAGVEPDVRMNPVLLKPSTDTKSQVIVMGEVRTEMGAKDYHNYKAALMPDVKRAFRELEEEFDIIVLEGAGSPAEINLIENDLANMGVAEELDVPVILVGDIDRGGVFAQLYGTVELLPDSQRDRIEGMIINKFRGDVDILTPGNKMLEEKMGKPILGVIPMLDVDLDDEDSMSARLTKEKKDTPLDIAVIRLPRISNFTDFAPLERVVANVAVTCNVEGKGTSKGRQIASVRYVRDCRELGRPDLIILPGTKNTMDDLLWLRESGMEEAVLKHAEAGDPVIGVCGGYQMLGEKLHNPDRLEGDTEELPGLGLLPIETTFTPDKSRTRVRGTVKGGPFDGRNLEAYEIHMGRTVVKGDPFCEIGGSEDGCQKGNVFGTYLHGLFDSGELTAALITWLAERKGLDMGSVTVEPRDEYVEQQYDKLAEGVRAALDMDKIYEIMERYSASQNHKRGEK